MVQIILQLPLSTGQIFDVRYHAAEPIRETHKESLAMPAQSGITQLQANLLQELAVFHHATADLLLRRLQLSPNSYRHVQKSLQALHAEKPDERYVEIIIPPKRDDSRFGSSPYVYTLGRRGYSYLRKRGMAVGRFR